jgi:predicted MFS family arabinose efflux permease
MTSLGAYIEVLGNKNFSKLWVSQVCSQLTNYLLSFTVLIKVFRMTESTLHVSLVLLSFGLATVVFGSLAGVYSDRFDRRKILTLINFLQALAVLAYIPTNDNFALLLLVTFVYSSLNQFYLPAEAPSIPNLVSENQNLVANSYFSFTGSVSMMLGFVLAGPMILWIGVNGVFVAGFAMLIIASISTSFLPPLKPVNHSGSYVQKVWDEFKEGVRHLWESPDLHFPLLSLIVAQVFNGVLITLAPEFVEKILGINLETGTIYMIAPIGLGILLGALLLHFENKYFSKQNLILAGFLGMGLIMLVIGLAAGNVGKEAYTAMALILGFFNAHVFAPSHSIVQGAAKENIRGRVYGVLYVLLQGAATLPAVFVGLASKALSAAMIMALFGCLLAVTGLVLWAVFGNKKLTT